jgi:polygalacturonase
MTMTMKLAAIVLTLAVLLLTVAGGGRVVVPKGRFLSGPLALTTMTAPDESPNTDAIKG